MYAAVPGRPVSSVTRLATATNENQSPPSETTLARNSRRKSRLRASTDVTRGGYTFGRDRQPFSTGFPAFVQPAMPCGMMYTFE
jgi:hypothetical protein